MNLGAILLMLQQIYLLYYPEKEKKKNAEKQLGSQRTHLFLEGCRDEPPQLRQAGVDPVPTSLLDDLKVTGQNTIYRRTATNN